VVGLKKADSAFHISIKNHFLDTIVDLIVTQANWTDWKLVGADEF